MANRTLGKDVKIIRLENGVASDDGLKVMFDVVTADGKSYPFWIADAALEKFVSYVIGLSQDAAGASGKLRAPEGRETVTSNPIDCLSLSIVPGRVPAEGLLAVHLGTFALTFSLSANMLQILHERLGQMLGPTEHSGIH